MRNDNIYTVIYSDRSTISLTVNADGSLLVRAPRGASRRVISEFVKSRADWIEYHRKKIPEPQTGAFAYGMPFRFRGGSYPLVAREGGYCGFDGAEFYMPGGLSETEIRDTMIKIYKSLALPVFREALSYRAAQMGLKFPSEVKITSAKKRWGSCGGKGGDHINFSWMLITVPEYDADYVVVHELSHIHHHDHGSEFWKAVDRYIPDRKAREARLDKEYKRLVSEGWFGIL